MESLRPTELPDFVTARLEKLELLLAMMNDADWELDEQERSPVLSALAYLCDPEDIIPDNIPGIGLLDDAVMIELAFRELRHEIDAYEDFCRYRKQMSRKTILKRDAAMFAATPRPPTHATGGEDAPSQERQAHTRQVVGRFSPAAGRTPRRRSLAPSGR